MKTLRDCHSAAIFLRDVFDFAKSIGQDPVKVLPTLLHEDVRAYWDRVTTLWQTDVAEGRRPPGQTAQSTSLTMKVRTHMLCVANHSTCSTDPL
jgi:hypothetical protein